ncbi:MAG: porin family protein [Bacteroidota bacterium]
MHHLISLYKKKLGDLHLPMQRKDWLAFAALMDKTSRDEDRPVVWWGNWRTNLAAASVAILLLLTTMTGVNSPQKPEGGFATIDEVIEAIPVRPRASVGPLADNADTTPENPQSISFDQDSPGLEELEEENILTVSQAQEREPVVTIFPLQNDVAAPDLHAVANIQAEASQEGILAETPNGKIPHESDRGPRDRLFPATPTNELRKVGPMAFADGLFNSNSLRKRRLDPLKIPANGNRPGIRVGLYGGNTRSQVELTGDNPLPGFTAGLRMEVLINKEWSFVTGLNYAGKDFSYDYFTVDTRGRNVPNAVDAELFMVEAPLLFRLNLSSPDKLHLYVQAGVVTMFTTQENFLHYDPSDPGNQPRGTPEELRSLTPNRHQRRFNTYAGNIQAAIGLEYPFAKRMALQVEPYFQMGLSPIKGSDALGLEKRLYTAGIGIGLLYGSPRK